MQWFLCMVGMLSNGLFPGCIPMNRGNKEQQRGELGELLLRYSYLFPCETNPHL